MPANKNAVIRYKYLDTFLSDRHHYYDIHDLTNMVNNYLQQDGDDGAVSQRTIELDLNFLMGTPFHADIVHERINGKSWIHYADPQFSIFKKALSKDEENLLAEVLNTIGQFDGLSNFEWLDGLKKSLGVKEMPKVISFSNPVILNSNLLGILFTAISNKVVIKLSYHTFQAPDDKKTILLHPYLLKEYNKRWFLIGAADEDGYMLTFALDRIDEVEECQTVKYKECKEDLTERYEDVVGVTIMKDAVPEDILLWVAPSSVKYIETKPLHGSQTPYTNEREVALRSKYPTLEGGKFFRLNCIVNTELKQLLNSYLPDIMVIEPESLRKQCIESTTRMLEKYNRIADL